MKTFDPAVIEFTQQLQSWHAGRVANLRLVVDKENTHLVIGSTEIEAGSELAKGIRIGVLIALEQLGKLPFSVTPCSDDDDEW